MDQSKESSLSQLSRPLTESIRHVSNVKIISILNTEGLQ